MADKCERCTVGMIGTKPILAGDWLVAAANFDKVIDDRNEKAKRFAVPHPGFANKFEFEAKRLLSRRAAMLQGADGSSPLIPDGWVLVPVEPTEDMIIQGFEPEPDESFSDEKEWEAYDAMSGCQQAAHQAKLCWAAMIAVAPKPEVK